MKAQTRDNFFGHRLTVDPCTATARCLYCGERMTDIAIEVSKGEPDESKRPIKRCKMAVWAEVE